jgi:pimeloyl-ACP methyl ester carboxylesterase
MPHLEAETRGDGSPRFVFLHGLNGNAGVWEGVEDAAADLGSGSRVYLDMPGHGRSDPLPRYSLGAVASAVADALSFVREPVVFVGHSMGGAVALALASGWFGVPVRGVFGLGIKTEWSDAERAHAASFATKPRRPFETREAAEAFLFKAAGLVGSDRRLDAFRGVGVVEQDAFYITADPAAASLAATWHNSVFDTVRVPVRLARGSADEMVPTEMVARHDPEAVVFTGAGHNAHVDDPRQVVAAVAAFASAL